MNKESMMAEDIEEKEVIATLETAHVKIDLESLIKIGVAIFIVLTTMFVFRQELVNDNAIMKDNIKTIQTMINHLEVKIDQELKLQAERGDDTR